MSRLLYVVVAYSSNQLDVEVLLGFGISFEDSFDGCVRFYCCNFCSRRDIGWRKSCIHFEDGFKGSWFWDYIVLLKLHICCIIPFFGCNCDSYLEDLGLCPLMFAYGFEECIASQHSMIFFFVALLALW
jgi:hypothetical protein